MTLISIASRQIWPQVLGLMQAKPRPNHLVLLHTTEEAESAGPARRLKELFASQKLLSEQAIELVLVPHDEYGDIMEAIANTAERLALDDSNCQLNFTGGNKLMALAATEWCRLEGVPCFYLERDFRVIPLLAREFELRPQEPLKLDAHLARDIEPLALLRCQLESANVVSPGQRLTLNQRGRKLPDLEITPLLQRGEDFQKFLEWDIPEINSNPGFELEFATAFALLKLGVPAVQRSIRLAPKVLGGSGREEGELDLVFNWAGKLWVVDCKDKHSAESKVEPIRVEILKQLTPDSRLTSLLNRLEEELRHRDLHPLKEDLLSVAEVGGLQSRAVVVRRAALPPQADEFAKSRRIEVVLKERLLAGLRTVLFPDGPASLEQLHAPAAARRGVRP
jgi:hypothetical protein